MLVSRRERCESNVTWIEVVGRPDPERITPM